MIHLFLFFPKVLTAFSENEVEVLVKLMQMNDNASTKTATSAVKGPILLDQQTLLITDNEAVFNFAAIATNADKLTIEVSIWRL